MQFLSAEPDLGGNLVAVTYPSGRTVTYLRDRSDKGGWGEPAGEPHGGAVAGGAGDHDDTVCRCGDGVIESRSYDLDGRLTALTAKGAQRTHSYDGNSNITGINEAAVAASGRFAYDALNRPTQAGLKLKARY